MVVDHVYADSLYDYWRKKYRLERELPYYLSKHGTSRANILLGTITNLLTPWNYVGRSPELILARSGATITGSLGRIVGVFDDRLTKAN
jgi:hypothetical protein